jgi:hypothetical protein
VIVAIPEAMPETMPKAETEATEVLLLLQDTAPEAVESTNVITDPTQTVEGPVMLVVGVAITVTAYVATKVPQVEVTE